jgi:hypothetical protein
MRSSMIITCYRTWSNKLKDSEMGGACGTHTEENIYRVLVGKTERKRPVRGSLILNGRKEKRWEITDGVNLGEDMEGGGLL